MKNAIEYQTKNVIVKLDKGFTFCDKIRVILFILNAMTKTDQIFMIQNFKSNQNSNVMNKNNILSE